MNSIYLEQLRIARDSAQARYYKGLHLHSQAYYNTEERNAEETHARLERLYSEYLEAKRKHEDALEEFFGLRPMTEYTSL